LQHLFHFILFQTSGRPHVKTKINTKEVFISHLYCLTLDVRAALILTCRSRSSRGCRNICASGDQLIAVSSVLVVQVPLDVVIYIVVQPALYWVEIVVDVDADTQPVLNAQVQAVFLFSS